MKLRTNLSIIGNLMKRNATAGDFDPLTGMRLTPRDPWVCFVENEDEDDDAGDGEDGNEKRYTEADVEKLIKRRLAKSNKGQAKELTALQKANESLQAQLTELTDKLEQGKSADEKSEKKQERALARAEAQIKELTEKLSAAEETGKASSTKLRSHIKSAAIRKALTKSGVLTKALPHAVKLMMEDLGAEILEEEGDDGQMQHVVVVKVDGKETDDIGKAAQRWLKDNTHFASHPGAGSGEKPPGRKTSAGGLGMELSPEVIEKADATSLIEKGFSEAMTTK